MAKTKEQKQREALERAKNYKFENSRAKRLGTKTKEQWTDMTNKIVFGHAD